MRLAEKLPAQTRLNIRLELWINHVTEAVYMMASRYDTLLCGKDPLFNRP